MLLEIAAHMIFYLVVSISIAFVICKATDDFEPDEMYYSILEQYNNYFKN